jgi:hypothetical protein
MTKQVDMSERLTQHGGMTKIERYGWIVKDNPGTPMSISKHELRINHEYQRIILPIKVQEIASAWSWVACGAISVAIRDGVPWVMDGQHRVMAAMRRSDITELPCLVFEIEDIRDEAQGFLNLNTNRKSMTSIDRLRAAVVAGHEHAVQFDALCKRLGISLTPNGNTKGQMKSADWGMRRMKDDPTTTTIVLELANQISAADEMPIQERLLEGLWHIHKNCEVDLTNARLRERIKAKGAKSLIDAANSAASYYSRGGGRIWASGMMNLINKGLRTRFKMRGDEDV